ncbi:MAG TPA: metal ABC transporter ATP-binding protein [bacterium]|nr:metal ABC transporter ATP-binding protein [bacterium]
MNATAITSEPIVRIEGVWVWRRGTLALKDVSLEIAQGKFVGLMGPNGGGKTTLLKVIAGLIKPDKGTVSMIGPTRKTVGYVPQEQAVDPQFPVTPQDVVEMGLYGSLGLLPRIRARERALVAKALDHVGMADLGGRRFGELSGGQKQRVFIARAIVGEPKLLLLDEPTTGVDARARDSFYRLLSKLRGDLGLTVILASHDLEVVPTQVDEIVCINQMVYVHAPPEEIAESDALSRAYGCELEFMAHGNYPHRVIRRHDEPGSSEVEPHAE